MIKNYLLIALRFMSKQRGFSVINLSGLTIGIACSLLILLYVQDELSYDTFHRDSDRMYKVSFDGKIQGKRIRTSLTGFPLGPELQSKFPEVESTLRLVNWATFPVHYEEKIFTEEYLLLSDPGFFRFFNFNLVEGNPDSVLVGERKVVISESAARRYFNYKHKGDGSAIGKTLDLAQGYLATVSGIAADPPDNSHLHYTLILSLDSWTEVDREDWTANDVHTYFKLKPGESAKAIEDRINALVKRKLVSSPRENSGSAKSFHREENDLKFSVHPLTDLYLRSKLDDPVEPNGSIEYIYLFCSIAAFITLLACINFMNLTTAQSASRAKEVAVRKTAGAQNTRLIFQFLLESYCYVFMAVALALFALLVALAPFNYFTGKHLNFSVLLQGNFLAGIIGFALITGLVAGSYPAFYLTQYNPVEVMKGNLRTSMRSYGIRNVLVVFQFFISSGLIIATIIVYYQLGYIQRLNVGFNKSNVIDLLHTRNLGDKGKQFKEELLKNPDIISASYCNRLPPNLDWQATFRTENTDKEFVLGIYEMDYEHIKTMGYAMTDGRFFSMNFEGDSAKVILNQRAAEKLGITNYEGVVLHSGYDQPAGRLREVIGIMKDFNFQSLRDSIQPMAIILGREPNWEMAIRVREGSLENSVEYIETLWKKFAPYAPFEYTVLEKNFEEKLLTEKRIGWLFFTFTILAILIACLGLVGLATFTADQQRKAIGIRKVLGATTSDIASLLNRDFLKLVLIANLLAWPIAGWFMNQWLEQFAFRISFPWWVLPTAGGITVLIAFFSVSVQAIRAASGNPVNSLRNE